MSSICNSSSSIVYGWVLLLAILLVLPDYLERRNAKLNIDWPRPPIPDHGRIVTLQHSDEDIQRYVIDEYSSKEKQKQQKKLLIASQADIYYEAYFPSDNCTKNFVILGGTNSATYLYHDLLAEMHAMNFCTLTFDWRAHGRSEDTPGDLTSELFMLDAAAIIQHVFGKNTSGVHVFGWSLGGFIGYQLAIMKPELVSSLIVYGSCACFGPIPDSETKCTDRDGFLKLFFSRGPVMRLLGTQLELALVAMAVKLHQPVSRQVELYFYGLRMDQKVRTPYVWLHVQGAKTFSNLEKIRCPFQQIISEHENLVTGATQHSMELEAALIPKAEPPVMLKDPSGRGYSHFALYEEGGLELIVEHLRSFYKKHA